MTTFIDIIKNNPGLCRTVFVFCCNNCREVVYSFAKYKRSAFNDAKSSGWKSINQDTIWFCPECTIPIEGEVHK